MKHPIRTAAAVAAFAFSGIAVASASEAEVEMVMKSIESAEVIAPMVDVAVENGVATLTGTVEDDITKQKILEAVEKTPGITKVEDNMETST